MELILTCDRRNFDLGLECFYISIVVCMCACVCMGVVFVTYYSRKSSICVFSMMMADSVT